MTIIDFEKKFIFIANKKTGSSSIHKYYKIFLSKNRIFSTFSIFSKPIGKHDTYLEIKKYLDKKKININDFYIFGFIRDPITRIKSSFLYEKKDYQHNYNLNNFDFNYYIKKGEEKHFHSINEVFYNEQNKLPNNVHIFKLENIENSIKIINKAIGKKNNNMNTLKVFNATEKKNLIIKPYTLLILKNRYKTDFEYYNLNFKNNLLFENKFTINENDINIIQKKILLFNNNYEKSIEFYKKIQNIY